jgi:Fe-S cluster biogenesis protein NfuA/nitrite reductase/ring-hydroxylating ferredoxin subunit
MMDDRDLYRRIERMEALLDEVEGRSNSELRDQVHEIVQALLELHGVGLERILERVRAMGEPGRSLIDLLARDPVVGSLLLLHGLHPWDLETRVRQALDGVRPYLRSHQGDVSLLGLEDGVVRLRMEGSCQGCPSSAMTLRLAIEDSIYEAAPDVTAIETVDRLVQLGQGGRARGARWEELEAIGEAPLQLREVGGERILLCRCNSALYAYENRCPVCRGGLEDARLTATALACRRCGHRYDVVHAGRGLDDPTLHLEPLPLLVENGRAKIALPEGTP